MSLNKLRIAYICFDSIDHLPQIVFFLFMFRFGSELTPRESKQEDIMDHWCMDNFQFFIFFTFMRGVNYKLVVLVCTLLWNFSSQVPSLTQLRKTFYEIGYSYIISYYIYGKLFAFQLRGFVFEPVRMRSFFYKFSEARVLTVLGTMRPPFSALRDFFQKTFNVPKVSFLQFV